VSRKSDREEAANWARKLLADDFVILDSETTGLGGDDQIVQLAVIDKTGAPLLNTFIRPTRPIPAAARSIHGITSEMVADAPTFGDVFNALLMAIGGKRCVIYNVDYDRRLLHQSEQLHKYERDPAWTCMEMDGWRHLALWECAMHWYSQWAGDWSSYHGNYRWQSLPGGDHSALGDARACLAVLKRMAETKIKEES